MSAYRSSAGFDGSTAPSTSSSLPNRPNAPPAQLSRGFKPAFQNAGGSGGGGGRGTGAPGAFAGFAPRTVASINRPNRTSSPVVAAAAGGGPQSAYSSNFQQGYQPQGYYPQTYQNGYAQQMPIQIRNPFAPTPPAATAQTGAPTNADADMEAQIAQWQSAYMSKDDSKPSGRPGGGYAATAPYSASADSKTAGGGGGTGANNSSSASGKPLTVQRSGGGQKWSDSTLLEWDPAHHRIFVGNLAGEVTDDSLHKAFARYASIQKARVIRDKVTTKSKGYGFVSFADSDDYFKAARDMQGKYIGSHPVKIKKSTTEIKAVPQRDNNSGGGRFAGKKGGGGKFNNSGNANREAHAANHGVLGPTPGGGITKKSSKTKGGLKILG